MKRVSTAPLLPGAVIGLMGGGQLGRMTALAARSLGYRVHALDPNPDCPARGVCDHFEQGALDDPVAAARFARGVDVVTCEREDIGRGSLAAIEHHAHLRPAKHVLALVQDRADQKLWLARRGYPVGPFALVSSLGEVHRALSELGRTARFKRRKGGFDGRAQWSAAELSAEQIWADAEGAPMIAEQHLDLAAELSVLVARSPAGEVTTHPVAHNFHERGALETSVMPALLEPDVQEAAADLALRIAKQLDVVGLLAVELFWTRDGQLLVNELAPRPHNTFHSTEWSCETSQFEQLVRAVCGLPLGSVELRAPTAIANLYGDLWLSGRDEALVDLLRTPGAHLRLYDKTPRPRRKLGHIAFTARSAEAALEGVNALVDRLSPPGPFRRAS